MTSLFGLETREAVYLGSELLENTFTSHLFMA